MSSPLLPKHLGKIFPQVITSSKYSQKMRKLSCKIFNDFYLPELPKRDFEYGVTSQPVWSWAKKWRGDLTVMERNLEKPIDLDTDRNMKYYPAHPQIRALTHTLREYGLYRDEHRDFYEAMKEKRVARGKTYRQRTGPYKETKK